MLAQGPPSAAARRVPGGFDRRQRQKPVDLVTEERRGGGSDLPSAQGALVDLEILGCLAQ